MTFASEMKYILYSDLDMIPGVSPKSNQFELWETAPALYENRNKIGRLFRTLKVFRGFLSASTSSTAVFSQ
jgi:hypothetical protein